MSSAPLSFAIDQQPLSNAYVILCEGGGDKNFFQELISARSLPAFYVTHPIEKLHPGGRDGYTQRLRSLRLQPGFDMVEGIIVVSDNDRDPQGSFKQTRRLIHEAGYVTPNRPFVTVPGNPAMAIVMLPNADEPGQLETLCLMAIRDSWPQHFECAGTYAECVGVQEWGIHKQERAKLRALISHICKKDPNTSISHLWHDSRELVVPLDHQCFDHLAAFIHGFKEAIKAAV